MCVCVCGWVGGCFFSFPLTFNLFCCCFFPLTFSLFCCCCSWQRSTSVGRISTATRPPPATHTHIHTHTHTHTPPLFPGQRNTRWSYRRRPGSLLLCACSMCEVNCSSAVTSHCLWFYRSAQGLILFQIVLNKTTWKQLNSNHRHTKTKKRQKERKKEKDRKKERKKESTVMFL